MNKNDLFEAINNINDSYITEAKQYKNSFSFPILKLVLVCSLLLCGIMFFNNSTLKNDSEIDQSIKNPTIDNAGGNTNYGYNSDEKTNPMELSLIEGIESSLYQDVQVVANGEFVLSNALKSAIGQYSDEVRYRVVVTMYDNSNPCLIQSESERLYNEGYTVAIESIMLNNETTEIIFTLHAEKNQLINFINNPKFGYYICLYNEYFKIENQPEVSYNGGMH